MSLLDEYSKDIEGGIASKGGATPSVSVEGTGVAEGVPGGDKDRGSISGVAANVINEAGSGKPSNRWGVQGTISEGEKQSQTIGTDSSVEYSEIDPEVYGATLRELEKTTPHPTYDSIRTSLGIPDNRDDEGMLKRLKTASLFKNIGNGLQLIAEGAGLHNGSSVEKQDFKDTSYEEFKKRLEKYKDSKDKLDLMVNTHLLQAEQARRQQLQNMALTAATRKNSAKNKISQTGETHNSSSVTGNEGYSPKASNSVRVGGRANTNVSGTYRLNGKNVPISIQFTKGDSKQIYGSIAAMDSSSQPYRDMNTIGFEALKDIKNITGDADKSGFVTEIVNRCYDILYGGGQTYSVLPNEYTKPAALRLLKHFQNEGVDISDGVHDLNKLKLVPKGQSSNNGSGFTLDIG